MAVGLLAASFVVATDEFTRLGLRVVAAALAVEFASEGLLRGPKRATTLICSALIAIAMTIALVIHNREFLF